MPIDPQLQEMARRAWSAGDWDKVAPDIEGVGPRLLDAIGVEPGMRLLDVAAGTGGSIAIPAAQRGAEVVASDLVADHFAAGRRRADAAGVQIEWVEANALDLPFEDNTFDRVTSTFGHMFAPDHALAAAELARVCRSGGAIGYAAWTPQSVLGRLFRLQAGFLPPPTGVGEPTRWGDEQYAAELLEPLGLSVRFEHWVNVFERESLDAYLTNMDANFGPTITAQRVLGSDRYQELRSAIADLYAQLNTATDGSFRVEAEYLQVVARKPG